MGGECVGYLPAGRHAGRGRYATSDGSAVSGTGENLEWSEQEKTHGDKDVAHEVYE